MDELLDTSSSSLRSRHQWRRCRGALLLVPPYEVGEFHNRCKQKIAYQYNQRGYESFKKKRYEEALKYLQMSLDFDPENAYTYYAMGMVYHSTGAIKDDPKIIKTAEENYVKALKYDPKHKESRVELEKLRKYSEKMGLKK